ncbi:hypothetical protein [Vulcanisaeta distributa]|uniref:hypothetical protein n=1 Tax=Vulcanisaeta distributa TaxID=164451 RepID=UPI001FB279DE|nr:hypothetical protein [Vulcanisaeta distributa]
MLTMIVGVLGLLFIAIGWVLALGDVPPLRLTIPYLIGSALLTAYSALNWNLIFLVLNGAATILSAINLIRRVRMGKVNVEDHG